MSPDGRCNENLLSITAPLAGTDFHFLKQFIGFPEANGPCPLLSRFFLGSYSVGAGVPSVPAERGIVPPAASWKRLPELTHLSLSRPGRVFAKNFFGLLSSPAQHKTHQLFPATGAGGEANPHVNPFPTKPRDLEPVIPRAEEPDPEVALSSLKSRICSHLA